MVAKLTRLTHKIVIQLYLVQRAVPFAVLAPGSQSRKFQIHPHMYLKIETAAFITASLSYIVTSEFNE
jgi:hypothetical protein